MQAIEIKDDYLRENGCYCSGFGDPCSPSWSKDLLDALCAVASENGWTASYRHVSRGSESRYVSFSRADERVSVRVSGHEIPGWYAVRDSNGELEYPNRFNLMPFYGEHEARSVREVIERLSREA